MGLSISIQKKSDYLAVTVTGEWLLDDLMNLMDTIKTESENHGCRRVLVDMNGVDKVPLELDRYELGKYAASILKNIRLAVVHRKEYINKLFENTSVNRGAPTYVVSDMETALQVASGKLAQSFE